MGFVKYAKASEVEVYKSVNQWKNVRTASTTGPLSDNLVEQASELLQEKFKPKNYLLSHATIVASVDTYEVSNARLGTVKEGSFEINRKYPNYRIKPECDRWINNNCFVEGTLITMSDGSVKPIEEVEVGDWVISHTGKKRQVTRLYQNRVDEEIYEIQPRGTMEKTYATGEHPFFVFRSNKSCVGCGNPLQRSVRAISHLVGKHYCSHACWRKVGKTNANLLSEKEGVFVEASNLLPCDYATIPVPGQVVPTELTKGQARLIGLFAAEGYYELYSYNDNERVGAMWAFHAEEENTLAKDVVQLLKQEFGVVAEIRHHSGCDGISVTTKTNREMSDFFSHWVLGAGSKTKKLHGDLLCAPLNIQREIVRGWLEGGGSLIATENDIRLVGGSASRSLVNQMQIMLHRLGVSSRIAVHETEGRRRLVVDGKQKIVANTEKSCLSWTVSSGGGWISDLVQNTVYAEPYATYVEDNGGLQKVPSLRYLNGYHLQKVGEVKTVQYSGVVYNFEVEKDHSYIANGMAVHNCDSWERRVLLASYPTFVGGENYVEHVQIPSQSKGKIIDAVARELDHSVYIDILVATNRKHATLISDIESGKMNSMSMGCFLAGTQVTLADGRRVSIEDVAPGDMVITHKGRAREVLNKQHRKGIWNLRKIDAVGIPSTISATDNHPFFVYRPKRFKQGHQIRILNPNGSYSLEEYRNRKEKLEKLKELTLEEVRADELQVGDYICFPKTEFGEETVSTGKARLLGYFLAEGSFLKYKGMRKETQFNFSMDEKDTYVKEVVSLLEEEFPDCKPWVQDREDRNTCCVHVYGSDIADWFYYHGGEYSNRKRLSLEAMSWPIEQQKHLLGTWLSGDGTLWSHAHNQVSGTTTSYDLACQIQALSIRCGLYVRLACQVKGETKTVQQVMNGGFVVRDESTGKLPNFELVYEQTVATDLSSYTDKAPRTSYHKERHLRVLEDMVIVPITAIEESSHTGWVYDMEVEEDHSYLVEGVAVHNCHIDFSQCTKCGHVAVDETEMCNCVKYEKGNVFYDEQGRKHRVAELCGHYSEDPYGGVRFIEASWVKVPAFRGAVLRNILTPEQISSEAVKRAQEVLVSPPKRWTQEEMSSIQKAATLLAAVGKTADFDFGDDPEEEQQEETQSVLEQLEETAIESATKKLKNQIKDRIDPPPSREVDPSESSVSEDGNLVESSMKISMSDLYRHSIGILVRTASSDATLINSVAELNKVFGVQVPVELYQASLRVGSKSRYPNLQTFIRACGQKLGRQPTLDESKTLIRLSKLLAARQSG